MSRIPARADGPYLGMGKEIFRIIIVLELRNNV